MLYLKLLVAISQFRCIISRWMTVYYILEKYISRLTRKLKSRVARKFRKSRFWKVRCPMSGVWCPELSGVRNSQQCCHKPTFSLSSRTYNLLIEHICVNPSFPLVRGTPPFSFSEHIPFLSFPPLTGCI